MKSEKSKVGGFTIEYTNYIKGIAVFLLLIHHFVFVPFHIPFRSGNLQELVVLFTKVCVALFAILSGYGITKSYQKNVLNGQQRDGQFTLIHIKKLLTNYWWVFIPTLVLCLCVGFRGPFTKLYGNGIQGILYCLLDFFGMRALIYSPTLCNTWWFIEATLVFYALFTPIYKCYKKAPYILLPVLFLPLVYKVFFKTPAFLKTTDREVFYLAVFAVGMVFADFNILDKAVTFSFKHRYKMLFGAVALLLFSMMGAVYIPMIGMLLFAVVIIFAAIAIMAFPYSIKTVLTFCGKYSMNVFLIHSLFMGTIRQKVSFEALPSKVNLLIAFLTVVIIAFAASYFLEFLKKQVKALRAHYSKKETK